MSEPEHKLTTVVRNEKGQIMKGSGPNNARGRNQWTGNIGAVRKAIHEEVNDTDWRAIARAQASLAMSPDRGSTAAANFLAQWAPDPETIRQAQARADAQNSAGLLMTGEEGVDRLVESLARRLGCAPHELPALLAAAKRLADEQDEA